MRYPYLLLCLCALLSSFFPACATAAPPQGGAVLVEEITHVSGANGVNIISKGAATDLAVNHFSLRDPARIVLDLTGAKLSRALTQKLSSDPIIKGVRTSQFTPNVVRVVFDLVRPIGYQVEVSSDQERIRIEVRLQRVLTGIALVTNQELPVLSLTATAPLNPQVFLLPKPDRLVIDLPETLLPPEIRPPAGNQIVKKVRLSQFTAEQVRIVLDLAKPLAWELGSPELLPVSGSALEVRLRYLIRAVTWEAAPDPRDGGRIIIQSDGPLPTQVGQAADGSLSLAFPHSREQQDLVLPKLPADLASLSWAALPGGRSLTVTLGQGKYYNLATEPKTGTVTLMLRPGYIVNKLIVVDPGHGGVDPGAIGKSGLQEKNVVLDIGLRLRSQLESLGAKVLMTREQDVFIPLIERPALANSKGADVFISIHNNSVVNPATGYGIETYAPVNRPQSLALAHAIQAQLLKATCLFNRGIKEKDWLVIREAEMPAVLVEAAFLSKEEEEALLATPEFRQCVAEALAMGLEAYFRQLKSEE